ncbi:2-keto-4-pentenoate hydratase [Nonomuraea thailandensis]|uniref:2-keto-4-pentenoate hydratase n=1 Tax=Nonomuraea thailandensis TaxID=1188745 RepID=A0A9X2G7E9_9ACTN|nr:2-keto-4-pentenoate hydratase [Nonomuraea thailandensis]MCP2353646.1 2-keto-4-pentenoate hydratase [Nonomuraea thailandensis]
MFRLVERLRCPDHRPGRTVPVDTEEESVNDIQVTADRLINAYATRVPIDPLTLTHPWMTLDDAYAVQLAQVEQWSRAGEAIKGHKVGLTSAAIQTQFGVDRPDYGHLTASMFHLDSTPIDVGRFLQPRIEPEIAFVLGKPLAGPGLTTADAVEAVDYLLPALEIIDSRIHGWKIKLADTVADNASSGGVVLGAQPVPLQAVDLRLAGCLLCRDGHVVQTGATGAVLGSPLNALTWLANTLGERGQRLEAGHVVLSGSITAAIPVQAGQIVTAEIAGLGSVSAVFAPDTATTKDPA